MVNSPRSSLAKKWIFLAYWYERFCVKMSLFTGSQTLVISKQAKRIQRTVRAVYRRPF
jgi:hypothetical protein